MDNDTINADPNNMPCWLIGDVLLKGQITLTTQLLCFYAALPTQGNGLEKSGFLKRYYKNTTKPTVQCNAILKDDVLIFFHSNSAIFITGVIQMREVMSISASKNQKNGFKISIDSKTFRFIADSDFSRDSWIKILKASAFNAAQDGNEVSVNLPLESICSLEMTKNVAKTETIKLKVFDEDNPKLFEEYFFTYFTDANASFETIKQCISDRKRSINHDRRSIDISAMSLVATGSNATSPYSLSNSPTKRSIRQLTSSNDTDSEESMLGLSVIKQHEWSRREKVGVKDRDQEIRKEFGIAKKDVLVKKFDVYLYKTIPRGGKVYVFQDIICFKSSVIGIKTKLLLKFDSITSLEVEKGSSFIPYRITLRTRDWISVRFDFGYQQESLEFAALVSSKIYVTKSESDLSRKPTVSSKHIKSTFDIGTIIIALLKEDELHKLPLALNEEGIAKISPKPMHITCLTIGTRGDVQPYIALCKVLMRDGHTCRIATHLEFKEWIESFGIEFREVDGDPKALIQLCVENSMFSYAFLREAKTKFGSWIDELLVSSWLACQGTDLIIEAPTAMAGVHIAETLNIPYFGSFTMPWTRTKYYPHPFGATNLGAGYNYMSHLLMENIFWIGIAPQVNRFRKITLNRPPIQLGSLNDHKIPFLYSFSPTVVPHPPDWQDWIHTCGYWFLDSESDWTPPATLVTFLASGSKPIYIGFGSIVVSDPEGLTDVIVEAVLKAGVRAVLSKGWSGRSKSGVEIERVYPDCIYAIEKVPHDWLFPLVAGVVHHGGAGTTAAGLRAGIPCMIKPFFGDQYFWAERIQELGVGLSIKKFSVSKLSKGFQDLVSNQKLIDKAQQLGVSIRKEDGVGKAVECIYRDMNYAKKRIEKLTALSAGKDAFGASERESTFMSLKRAWQSMLSVAT